ncbi:ABC transporter permease [Siculibacillus lacustris]|uniref:ABC transporter permease n=1 Tax=Siculibacillus lacustris TaxID=1549641 RepID=A0A4Q9VQV0_9HYPH|nr:ABC transporter permease [Siculibacillus lacustris]TBW37364.1 ABC transporter permease [Siculibacillus lacustris]
MNPLPMILADLRGLRWNAVVVVVLVAVAVAVGIALGAQERAFRHASARAADDFPLLIGAAGSNTQLVLTSVYLRLEALPLMNGAALARLGTDERVAAVAPIAFGDVVAGHPVIGTTAAFAGRWGRLAPIEGRMFAAENEAVIGSDARLAIGDDLKPSHGHAGAVWPTDLGHVGTEEAAHVHAGAHYKVVGRLAPTGGPWDRAVIVPVETVWETHGLGNGHAPGIERIGPPFDAATVPDVPAIVVKPKSFAAAYQLRGEWRRGVTQALFPAEVLVELHVALGDVQQILLVASALDDGLVFLAVTALLVTVVGLRRRRYAVLRALGAPQSFVLATVWGAAAVLMVAGASLGLGLGWGAAIAVSQLIAGDTGLAVPVTIGAPEILWAGAVALAGSLFALIPAWVAGRGSVIDGLSS